MFSRSFEQCDCGTHLHCCISFHPIPIHTVRSMWQVWILKAHVNYIVYVIIEMRTRLTELWEKNELQYFLRSPDQRHVNKPFVAPAHMNAHPFRNYKHFFDFNHTEPYQTFTEIDSIKPCPVNENVTWSKPRVEAWMQETLNRWKQFWQNQFDWWRPWIYIFCLHIIQNYFGSPVIAVGNGMVFVVSEYMNVWFSIILSSRLFIQK